jgi:N-acetylglucosaminyldiphosphoundecaprenol N-acetyl-beta-D-mannosaminyltransferase
MVRAVSRAVQAVILHVNVNGFNLALQLPWMREFYNSVPLVFCDGDGIRWGLRSLGMRPPPKTTYNVFLWEIARVCEEKGYRLFLLGARPGVAEQAASNLISRYPRLTIATSSGYFQKHGDENELVIAQINNSRAHVLVVCFGMPTQELWVRDNAHRLNVNAIFTGGAALDYAAGIARMTPNWIARWHLEWLFRYVQEPRRLFRRYILGNPAFVMRIWANKLRKKLH